MTPMISAMTGSRGERVALADVSVAAVLRDLLAEVSVSQTYRNDEKVNIEAVYTFPLPLDAVLLDMQVKIGERTLNGVVVEKKAAEAQYEETVAAGDAAVMLEEAEPGLYTMNVGNLLPGETASVTLRYALLYRWAGERLRILLPTTIAPRYGASPLQPHQAPEHALTVENRFSLALEIYGSLRDAQFECPSHQVVLTRSEDHTTLAFARDRAVMDRDFVLNVRAPNATRSFALCGADGEGAAAIASFQPFFPGLRQPRPLNLAIVIDCSGSMQGDSIQQARQALEGILDALTAGDRVGIIAFGNSTKAFAHELLPCTPANLGRARKFAKALHADMGGTEIGAALQAAFGMLGDVPCGDVFLVTDGEVSAWQEVVAAAKSAGDRIFTVGVGSAVTEAFVRGLAVATGGHCELVAPAEGMADKLVRHFGRMRAPRATRTTVRWPAGAIEFAPADIGAVFEGDTVTTCARFTQPLMGGSAVLEIETESGQLARQEVAINPAPLASDIEGLSTVARLAAAARLKEMDGAAAAATALRYRLVSRWTNVLVVAERVEGEKAHDLPQLHKVPQTLAAGHAGVGSVLFCMSAPDRTLFDASNDMMSVSDDRMAFSHDFSRIQYSKASPRAAAPVLPEPMVRLIDLIEKDPGRLRAEHALDLLAEAGLDAEFGDLFALADETGVRVELIAALVLSELLRPDQGLAAHIENAIAELRDWAARASNYLLAVAKPSDQLVRLLGDRFGREVLDPQSVDAARDLLARHAQIRDLVNEAKARAQRVREAESAGGSSRLSIDQRERLQKLAARARKKPPKPSISARLRGFLKDKSD